MNFLSLKERIINLFAIDYRTLGIFRMCVAFIVMVDIMLRCRDFSAFFTEQGIVPRNYAINWFSGNSTYSQVLSPKYRSRKYRYPIRVFSRRGFPEEIAGSFARPDDRDMFVCIGCVGKQCAR